MPDDGSMIVEPSKRGYNARTVLSGVASVSAGGRRREPWVERDVLIALAGSTHGVGRVGSFRRRMAMKVLASVALTCALAAGLAAAQGEWRRLVVNGQAVFAVPSAAARAAELPWEELPDAENAALPYLRAGELPLDPPPEFLSATEKPWGPEWKTFHAWFEATEPLRRDLRAGAALKRCRFPWLVDSPGPVTFWDLAAPHLPAMRRLNALMVVEGNLARKQGKPREAMAAYRVALDMARHVGGQPTLIAGVSAVTMADEAVAALRRTLAEDALSAADLAWLAGELAEAESVAPDFTPAFRAEQACAQRTLGPEAWLELAEAGRVVQPGPATESFIRSRAFAVLFPDRTLRRDVEQAQATLLASLNGPTWEAAAAMRRNCRGGVPLGKDWNPLLAGLSYSLWRAHAADLVLVSDLRALRTEVALRRYRAARGEWPATLAALEPEFIAKLPLDPFSGAAFLYRRAGEQCHFYSIGPDAKDHGGKEGRKPQLYESGDIVYLCEVKKP
jgi:hypothetical protein